MEGCAVVPSLIEDFTGVSVRSPFFSGNPTLELFPAHNKPDKKNRVALLYGSNGSGKSTIAQGFREYIEFTQPRSVEIRMRCGNAELFVSPSMRLGKIFVFDEKYVEQSVKIRASGLDAIVLFGQQIQLEQEIQTTQDSINVLSDKIQQQDALCRRYSDSNDTFSPQAWIGKITKILQESGGWAETSGIKIKHNRTSTRVNESEIDRLGKIQPNQSLSETQGEFSKTYALYSSIDFTANPIQASVRQIQFDENIETVTSEMLSIPLKRPVLSERESELLDMFGMKAISDSKGFLVDYDQTICPMCLQPVSDEYRATAIQKIENILNRDVEDFREKLKLLFQNECAEVLHQAYSVIDAGLYSRIKEKTHIFNAAVQRHNNAIQCKIDNPFDPVDYSSTIGLADAYRALNVTLEQMETARLAYNNMIAGKRRTELKLLRLNDELAYYAINGLYSSLCKQRSEKTLALGTLDVLQKDLLRLNEKLQYLDAQRKNYQIAVDQINKSLEYIFYAKDRLSLELGADQLYHLKSYGQPVAPEKVSCGERNALALCYFFSEMAKNTDSRSLYSDECLLVIDDPISSFDVENRVGMLSFLRFKLNQVLSACATTKVLVMTHDISVLFDLQKAFEEIAKHCKAKGMSSEFQLVQLKDKHLEPFGYKRHNEYTDLLRKIYNYARNPDVEQEYVIGNVMRRVLEAFSSFSFKKGIEDVSLDENILAILPDEASRMYFQNSMYRLVLNGESHFEEAIQGHPETSFFSHLSAAEKQRTAKDILCFIYKINRTHTIAHLPDAGNDLETWWSNITTPN